MPTEKAFQASQEHWRQVKVRKGHQVQIFKKSIFELLCTEKVFWASWEVKIRSSSQKVTKSKFLKSLFLNSYAQKRPFGIMGDQNQVKVTKGPNAVKCKISRSVCLSCLCTEKAFRTQKLRFTAGQGHQWSSSAKVYAKFQKSPRRDSISPCNCSYLNKFQKVVKNIVIHIQ